MLGRLLPASPHSIMRTLSAIVLSATLSASLSAQAYSDSFSYPDGPTVPGWTQNRGTFVLTNGRLAATSGSTWAYITKDGIQSTNCVLDGTFYYSPNSTVQFAGLTSRHTGTNQDSGLLMTKIQNNGGVGDLDIAYSYERGGAAGNTTVTIPGGTFAAYCRMVTLDSEFWMEVDADQDGLYELQIPRRTLTTVTAPGLVGMCAFQTTEMDDFEYFDAVLVPQPGAVPQIGTSYGLRIASTTPNVPFLAGLSLGNAGVPLGDGRKIPLSVDALLLTSIGNAGLGLTGLTDANGDATTAVPLPNDASLVGLRLYAGAFTFDGNRPLQIGDITNEHGFVIQ